MTRRPRCHWWSTCTAASRPPSQQELLLGHGCHRRRRFVHRGLSAGRHPRPEPGSSGTFPGNPSSAEPRFRPMLPMMSRSSSSWSSCSSRSTASTRTGSTPPDFPAAPAWPVSSAAMPRMFCRRRSGEWAPVSRPRAPRPDRCRLSRSTEPPIRSTPTSETGRRTGPTASPTRPAGGRATTGAPPAPSDRNRTPRSRSPPMATAPAAPRWTSTRSPARATNGREARTCPSGSPAPWTAVHCHQCQRHHVGLLRRPSASLRAGSGREPVGQRPRIRPVGPRSAPYMKVRRHPGIRVLSMVQSERGPVGSPGGVLARVGGNRLCAVRKGSPEARSDALGPALGVCGLSSGSSLWCWAWSCFSSPMPSGSAGPSNRRRCPVRRWWGQSPPIGLAANPDRRRALPLVSEAGQRRRLRVTDPSVGQPPPSRVSPDPGTTVAPFASCLAPGSQWPVPLPLVGRQPVDLPGVDGRSRHHRHQPGSAHRPLLRHGHCHRR